VGAVLLASNVIAVAVNVIESVVLGNTALFLFQMNYHGLQALQVGFLVAFTQLIPEHQVQVFGGLIKVRVKVRILSITLFNSQPSRPVYGCSSGWRWQGVNGGCRNG
jgi:hypothetical protein